MRDLNGDDDGEDNNELLTTTEADKMYQITVRATEQTTSGSDPRALSTQTHVTVEVTNADEKGTATMNRLQPEVGTPITVIWSDPDDMADTPNITFQWYVSKVTSPLADAPRHWIEATGVGADGATYTPCGDRVDGLDPAPTDSECGDPGAAVDEDKYLRVMVSYDDVLETGREIIAVSENTVREEVTSDLDGVENPTNGSPGFRDKGNEDKYTRTVSEDIAVGSSVGDAVVARDPNDDTLTYDLDVDLLDADSEVTDAAEPTDEDDGDIEFFSIDPASGMVTVKKGLNYEDHADGYTIFVRAVDPSGETDHVEVTIKVDDANDAPEIMGSSLLNALGQPIDENEAVRTMMPDAPSELRVKEKVGSTYDGTPGMPLRSLPGDMNVFTASDEDARHQTFWSIKGDDVDDFQLTSSSPDPISGLRGPGEPIALKFINDPDFENPTDDNLDSVYKVTLVARDRFTGGLMDERPLTIFVTNEQEDGEVVLDEDQPLIGQPITASVVDPDNGVAIVTWRWEKGNLHGRMTAVWEVIPGATTDTYRPKPDNKATDDRNEDDNGNYLRAICDLHGHHEQPGQFGYRAGRRAHAEDCR